MTWRRVRRRLRRWWRLILAWLLVRRFTPDPWERLPTRRDTGGPGDDTGGGTGWYRPPHRQQDPSVDPREPGSGDSSSEGQDHGWSGCTMSASAMALTFAKLGGTYWGGDMRHAQGDLDGGTDLYDAAAAFSRYGEVLGIRSGAGWKGLEADLAAGRALVVQGSGNVPGSATFDGGHACCISPETRSGDDLLFGDPLASGWQWVSRSSVRTWMEEWAGSGLAYARTVPHLPATPAPEPEPEPCPDCPPDRYQEGLETGRAEGEAAGQAATLDGVFTSWVNASPRPWATWGRSSWDMDSTWSTVPYPVTALLAARDPAAWDVSEWAAALWRDEDAPPPVVGVPWDLADWAAEWAA